MITFLTWHAGDAKNVRVADEEVLQNVSGLVGVDDNDLRGGVCGGADPHQAGEFILMPEFLFLLLNTHLMSYTESETRCLYKMEV